MTKKNEPLSYTFATFWHSFKKELSHKVVSFAVGALIALGAASLTILADHSRINALEVDKADKKELVLINYKLDLMLEHFELKAK
jgi:hypothetical protein